MGDGLLKSNKVYILTHNLLNYLRFDKTFVNIA